MESKNMFSEFDCLIGTDIEQIIEYFGQPDRFAQSMLLYQRPSASLVVLMEPAIEEQMKGNAQFRIKEIVSGIIFLSPEEIPLYAKGVHLLTKTGVERLGAVSGIRIDEVTSDFGEPFTGLGSLFLIPAYFTDYGAVLLLYTADEIITHVREVPLMHFFGNSSTSQNTFR